MRELKFRAWDVNQDEMISWEDIEEQWGNCGYHDSIFRNDHYITMQFTGIKNKNGVEVYEGDVFKHKNKVLYQVVFNQTKCRFCVKMSFKGKEYGSNFIKSLEWAVDKLELIGNIHTKSAFNIHLWLWK